MEKASKAPAMNAIPGGRLRHSLSYLRSLFFTIPLIYFYTGVCGTLSLCGSVFDGRGRWQHGCARAWSWLILKTSRVQVKVEGAENINPNQAVVLCVNHSSTMDIPILFVYLPVQFRFLAKRSLFHVPFLGWHLRRSGHIPVDRDQPRQALRSLDEAAKKVREGSPVVVFPEGHRSRDGKMLPFKSGGFYLAIRAGVPIVPITLNGTRQAHRPDTFLVRPAKTNMIIHRPILTQGLTLDDVESLSERVRREILSRLRLEPTEDLHS